MPISHIWPCGNTSHNPFRKAQHSHLIMREMNPEFMLERLCTYIWPCEEPIQHTRQKGSALTFDHARNQSNIHVERALHLHLTMRGTNPAYMSKRLLAPGWGFLVTDQVPPFSQRMESKTYIWSCGNTSLNHIRMALHLYLIMWEHIQRSYQNGPQL